VDHYAKKYKMRKNDISLLFYDKEDCPGNEEEAGKVGLSEL
jgi:hypothetical protein